MTYCTNCGAQVPTGAKFCVQCGTPAAVQVSTAATATIHEMPHASAEAARLESIRLGQRMIIWGILTSFAVFGVSMLADSDGGAVLALLVVVAYFILAFGGLWRLSRGFGNGVLWTVILCALMLVPLLALIIMAVYSSRATTELRKAGYTVGLFGAPAKAS